MGTRCPKPFDLPRGARSEEGKDGMMPGRAQPERSRARRDGRRGNWPDYPHQSADAEGGRKRERKGEGEGRESEKSKARKVGGGLGQGPHHTNNWERSEREKAALPAVGEAITWCLVTAPQLERLRGAASAPQRCSRSNRRSSATTRNRAQVNPAASAASANHPRSGEPQHATTSM